MEYRYKEARVVCRILLIYFKMLENYHLLTLKFYGYGLQWQNGCRTQIRHQYSPFVFHLLLLPTLKANQQPLPPFHEAP